MNTSEFFSTLSKLKKKYDWQVDGDNKIVAVESSKTYNPITAIAKNTMGYKPQGNSKRETIQAGKSLGLTKEFCEQVYNATISTSNRGNVQVVRGRIRSALNV